MENPYPFSVCKAGAEYRYLARELRELALLCHFPTARRDLLRLGASFDRKADHFDTRASASGAPASAAESNQTNVRESNEAGYEERENAEAQVIP